MAVLPSVEMSPQKDDEYFSDAIAEEVIFHITRARVSMPKSTPEFIERCATSAPTGIVPMVPIPLPA